MTLPTPKEEAREELLHHNHIESVIENYGETLIIRTRKAVAKELRKILKTNTNEMGETELEVEISNLIVELDG